MPECKSGKLVKNVLLFPKNFESDLAAGLAFFMITLTSISRNIGHTNRFQIMVMYKNVFQLKYFYRKPPFDQCNSVCKSTGKQVELCTLADAKIEILYPIYFIVSQRHRQGTFLHLDILFQAFYCLSRYPGGGQALNCQGSQTVEVDIPNYDWSCTDNDDRCPGKRMS